MPSSRCPYHPHLNMLPTSSAVPDSHGRWWRVPKLACPRGDYEKVIGEPTIMTLEEIRARGLSWPLPVIRPLALEEQL